MDIGLFRGILTLVLFIAFLGIVAWAYNSRRKEDFEEAANLPLDDERIPGGKKTNGDRHD